jgi:hypothetical protein
MDAHQAKIDANQKKWMTAMKTSPERMEEEACLKNIEANQGKVGIKM